MGWPGDEPQKLIGQSPVQSSPSLSLMVGTAVVGEMVMSSKAWLLSSSVPCFLGTQASQASPGQADEHSIPPGLGWIGHGLPPSARCCAAMSDGSLGNANSLARRLKLIQQS